MNILKLAATVIACSFTAIANASVYYTNESPGYQTLTINQTEITQVSDWYENWSYDTFTVSVAPGEQITFEDIWRLQFDGGYYALYFDLVSVE
jgi:hypothetical protein